MKKTVLVKKTSLKNNKKTFFDYVTKLANNVLP
jgi:hypothetical protein